MEIHHTDQTTIEPIKTYFSELILKWPSICLWEISKCLGSGPETSQRKIEENHREGVKTKKTLSEKMLQLDLKRIMRPKVTYFRARELTYCHFQPEGEHLLYALSCFWAVSTNSSNWTASSLMWNDHSFGWCCRNRGKTFSFLGSVTQLRNPKISILFFSKFLKLHEKRSTYATSKMLTLFSTWHAHWVFFNVILRISSEKKLIFGDRSKKVSRNWTQMSLWKTRSSPWLSQKWTSPGTIFQGEADSQK